MKKILDLKGVKQITKKEQITIIGGHLTITCCRQNFPSLQCQINAPSFETCVRGKCYPDGKCILS